MSTDLNPIGNLSLWYRDKPIIQSLLKLVYGGSSLDTLLQRRATEIKADRLKVFFDELAQGDIPLTEDLIEGEPFLHSFFCTVQAVTRTHQREKIRLFARLLRTSISPNMLTIPDECEELIATLETISLREFAVLNCLYRLEQAHPPHPSYNPYLEIISMYWNTFLDEVIDKHEIPADSVNAFMARLERTGLYLRITGAYFDYAGDQGRTTPLFRRLLEFVEDKHAPPTR